MKWWQSDAPSPEDARKRRYRTRDTGLVWGRPFSCYPSSGVPISRSPSLIHALASQGGWLWTGPLPSLPHFSGGQPAMTRPHGFGPSRFRLSPGIRGRRGLEGIAGLGLVCPGRSSWDPSARSPRLAGVRCSLQILWRKSWWNFPPGF